MEVLALAIFGDEGRPPADDVFACSGWPQQYLPALLAQVPDPRKRRGRRHPLAGLLAVGVAAVIAGSGSFAAIGQRAADAGPEVLAVLGAAGRAAEESAFRRAFAMVSADVPDRVLGAWLWTRAVQAGGRLVIAADGKALPKVAADVLPDRCRRRITYLASSCPGGRVTMWPYARIPAAPARPRNGV